MNLDRSDLREKVKATISPQTTMARFQDIPFAIDQLGKMNASTLNGRIDLGRIGMSGHSFGAITTMALAGQVIGGGRMNFADTRITAAIAYSPSKPRQGDATVAFASVKIPTFHMTGTLDKNPLDTAEDPSTRQIPYRSIAGADKFLMVFTDGDHMVYSGRTFRGGPRPTDAKFHALVQKASLAFWDTYLRNAPAARTYLTGGQFARELGSDGTFEFSDCCSIS
jgi:predicted dienelactone hydrolase